MDDKFIEKLKKQMSADQECLGVAIDTAAEIAKLQFTNSSEFDKWVSKVIAERDAANRLEDLETKYDGKREKTGLSIRGIEVETINIDKKPRGLYMREQAKEGPVLELGIRL
jgi:hypothetical protein